MPFGLGIGETMLIFLVVLLLFGAKRLPEIGTSLGRGIREFKSSVREIETSVRNEGELEAPREHASSSQAADGADKKPPRRLTQG